jgi:hypothetical protein
MDAGYVIATPLKSGGSNLKGYRASAGDCFVASLLAMTLTRVPALQEFER